MKYSPELQKHVEAFLVASVKPEVRDMARSYLTDLLDAAFNDGELAQIKRNRERIESELESLSVA